MYPGVRMDCYALQRKTCDLPPVFTALFSKTPVKIRYPRSYDFIKITVFSHALRVFPVTFSTKPLYAETGKASNIPLCQSYKSYINIRPSFSQDRLYLSKIKLNQCPPAYPQILRIPLPVLHHRRLHHKCSLLHHPETYPSGSGHLRLPLPHRLPGCNCVHRSWSVPVHKILQVLRPPDEM